MSERRGRYVLYWMQASQRAVDNPALDVAVEEANSLSLPVLCVFGLTASYPEANLRHFAFMLEGLRETRQTLEGRGIQLAVVIGSPDEAARSCASEAALVVCDRGYLRHQKRWRRAVARGSGCRVLEVEGDVVVPVGLASDRREWSAATLRPKIHRMVNSFVDATDPPRPRKDSLGISTRNSMRSLDPSLLDTLPLDRSVPPVRPAWGARGGTSEALVRLMRFVSDKLPWYGDERQDPVLEGQSGLSPYLHFGQISPARIAREVAAATHAPEGARAAFLEQLLVRRELAMNFVEHTPDYDRFSSLPAWARRTLEAHAHDARPWRYTPSELEGAATHDPFWNAAMKDMKLTGSLHGHMRMYWGKKILEWSGSPAAAFRTALRLNNRWLLDGRDPCSYAGVAWCFGLHDRPWPERPVFGTVRCMKEAGLQRKFDMAEYVRRVEEHHREG
ncbi:MAG TPA: deoxyribodipyrimidine photo-lyase [Spirochaetia bacterium]|nr:deoxyribodipyrimidine photo-lyase [Spirochaetia bacterium]